jgi:hypothetical protein
MRSKGVDRQLSLDFWARMVDVVRKAANSHACQHRLPHTATIFQKLRWSHDVVEKADGAIGRLVHNRHCLTNARRQYATAALRLHRDD